MMALLRELRELYSVVYSNTESFEVDDIGADLAYLMGAIVSDDVCTWPADRPLVLILKAHFQPSHEVWRYVRLEGGEPK
jgi:hypothetical protein